MVVRVTPGGPGGPGGPPVLLAVLTVVLGRPVGRPVGLGVGNLATLILGGRELAVRFSEILLMGATGLGLLL